MIDVLILASVGLVIGFAVGYIRKQKGKGVQCVGCPDASACSGSCGSCSCCGK